MSLSYLTSILSKTLRASKNFFMSFLISEFLGKFDTGKSEIKRVGLIDNNNKKVLAAGFLLRVKNDSVSWEECVHN